MRALAPATVAALRQVPNAPGLVFKVYLRHKGWNPGDPDIVTDFSEYVVQDSLGSIDWSLERDYAQLSPGDVQFKVRDTLDQFETVVVRAPSPCEVQIWAAPAWGGAGDWAMLFHGYVEPSGITRAQAELGSGGEPTVPLKDVYAKSYLSARLDSMRPGALCFWNGVQPLEYIVRRLGDNLISAAGHEPIDYDIQIRHIPTLDGRLVLSAWEQPEYAFLNGGSWIVREDDGYWYVLMWYGLTRRLVQYRLDKRTYRVSNLTDVLIASGSGWVGRFHYVDATYVLLTLSNPENFTSALDRKSVV